MRSNVTFSKSVQENGVRVADYFEGTNIAVYIRGKDDDTGDWWKNTDRVPRKKGVLVNAHYDS